MPTDGELELSFYEKFLWSRGLEPYPVQEQAIGHIFAGKSLLVTVPTGTGKTLMAKAALHAALGRGHRAIYTTPLRALTEEKYRELCADFGEDNVGFATGDYKVNREAPIQVEVAEILWNRIVADKHVSPAEIVVMDEGHYFNDLERGYVWEQSIIGLDPRTQLVVLSATVGHPERFCHWVELTRRVPMALVESRERKVPLVHEFREEMLIDTVGDLAQSGDVPAIVFVFGREQCFEVARLLKSRRRFTTDEEKAKIDQMCDEALLPSGVAKELRPLLAHGIGIHHAGILPRYKQLVEQLALERLIKFVVSTETIAAGINLPARTVVFPALRKFIKQQARMVTAAEYHQMAGRAGRPQFDDRGLAITLAPEQIVSDLKKELKDAAKRAAYDEAKVRKSVYNKARSEAQRKGDIVWTPESHAELVKGEPAELRSKTKITAEQVLAIGLPDLAATRIAPDPRSQPGGGGDPDGAAGGAGGLPRAIASVEARMAAAEASLPPSMRLDIVTVIENLLLEDRERFGLQKMLAQLVDNLKAIGVIDEHGTQIAGQMIRDLQGMDGLFIYYVLFNHQLDYVELRQLVEYMIDHDVIQRMIDRKDEDAKREWCRTKLRELREGNPHVTWEDVEAEWDKEHPRPPTKVETIHAELSALVPHPELHGGKRAKNVWALLEDSGIGFLEFVARHSLEHEEGNLFSYLVRVMNFARKLGEASQLSEFEDMAERVQKVLARVDIRLIDDRKW
ncbi:MAG TPA: DEAD/DEAH box helicase [Kofleriaceae bacterium]|nr:DEAD/DEAH box helicase [Kofleriaceae bacterium]